MFTALKILLNKVKGLLTNSYAKTVKISETESLNKVSLGFIILIDIFIFINIFSGLQFAANIIPANYEIYPCKSDFYISNTANIYKDNIYKANRNTLDFKPRTSNNLPYKIAPICLEYQDKFNNLRNQLAPSYQKINQLGNDINIKNSETNKLKQQYDSALLEKIADQKKENSINDKSADEIKTRIDQLDKDNQDINSEITKAQNSIADNQLFRDFINFVRDKQFEVNKDFNDIYFWYEIQVLVAQIIFLLPIILVTLLLHRFSIKKEWNLLGLIFWHIFLITLIPVIYQIFNFIQFGLIFGLIFGAISQIFSGFLIFGTYGLIIIIPLVGFGLIKITQKFVFNEKIQSQNRIQKMKCIHCSRKLRIDDNFCPFCGTDQFQNCTNCNKQTYKYQKHCKHCGHKQVY
jgi:predicted RNA-binding Zn-ribbon protein involved in translation (DUF1610 family)